MKTLDRNERKFLLSLARRAILYYFDKNEELELSPGEVPSQKLVEDRACFVTLRKGGKLRGCIGTLEAQRPLFRDVIRNSLSASFWDPRFPPLTREELENTGISISVLTSPEPLEAGGPEELLEKLVPGKHGLILEKGPARATFLPSVWTELPEKRSFLEHLSLKAGLGKDGWKDRGTRYFVYESEEFSEQEYQNK